MRFRIRFGGNIRRLNLFFFRILRALASAFIGGTTDNIAFASMRPGSVDAEGEAAFGADPGSLDAGTELNNFNRLLNSGSIGGVEVESSSATIE